MTDYRVGNRSKLKRISERGSYSRNDIFSILDGGFIAHVGIVKEDQPFVLPMVYVRLGESVFLHGSVGSRLMQALAQGAKACIAVTHLDGIVFARSAFHHSMNYRSAMIFGTGKKAADDAVHGVLTALMERLAPGRSRAAREPSPVELRQTLVVEVPIEEASAKSRTGPPKDEPADYGLDVWAGVLPLSTVAGVPEPDGAQTKRLPDYLQAYTGPFPLPSELEL